MSKLDAIRQAIVQVVRGVPDAGIVHPYERWAPNQKAFAELYIQNGVLCGWHLRRPEKRERHNTSARRVIDNQWHITGYRALEDAKASEIRFDNTVEAICDALTANNTLGGVILDLIVDGEGLGVTDSQPVMFCGVLCHSAKIVFITRHFSS